MSSSTDLTVKIDLLSVLYLIKPFSRSVLKEFLLVLLEILRLACIGLLPELSVNKPKPALANTEVLSMM